MGLGIRETMHVVSISFDLFTALLHDFTNLHPQTFNNKEKHVLLYIGLGSNLIGPVYIFLTLSGNCSF